MRKFLSSPMNPIHFKHLNQNTSIHQPVLPNPMKSLILLINTYTTTRRQIPNLSYAT